MACGLRRAERMKWILFFLFNSLLLPSVIAQLNETGHNYEDDEHSGSDYEVLLALGKPILQSVLETFAPASGKVENALCRNHSRIYLEELQKGTLWALKMFDTSTKIPQGMFHKTFLSFGNFDGCQHMDVILGNDRKVLEHHFTGKFCVALVSFDLEVSPAMSAMYNKLSEGVIDSGGFQNLFGMSEDNFLNKNETKNILPLSYCIPSSCTDEDFGISLHSSLSNLLKPTGAKLTIHNHERLCTVRSEEVIDEATWVMIGVLGLVVVLIVLATIYDLRLRRNPSWTEDSGNIFLVSFSAYTNVKNLLTPCASKDIIRCLYGLRVLSLSWVVLGHALLPIAVGAVINPQFIENELKGWFGMPMFNATLSVDTFFLMAGLVLTYLFLKNYARNNSFSIPKFFIIRYIRLTPAMAAIVALFATVFYYAGSGPFWKAAMMKERTNCRESYWYNFLYIQNYLDMDRICAPNTWYLAAETQMYWLSPLVLIPISKSPKIGVSLAVILLVGFSAVAAVITYTMHLPWIFKINPGSNPTYDVFNSTMSPAYTRAQVYMVGILIGFILHKLRDKTLKLSKVVVAIGWIASTAISLTVVYSVRQIYKADYVYDATEAAVYAGFSRTTFAICVSWVIFACHKGYGGFVNSFLSWKVWEPLSTLTYSAYLCNTFVTLHNFMGFHVFPHIDHYDWLRMFFGDLGLTYLMSIFFYLMFEAPFAKMVKYYMSKKGGGKPRNVPKVELKADELKGQETENKNYVNNGFNVTEDKVVEKIITHYDQYRHHI